MGMPLTLIEILSALTVIIIFNMWEHSPTIVPNHYSDVTSIFWREGIGKGEHLIPYFQFSFEYPVIVGIFVYLCSLSRVFINDFSTAMTYYTFAMQCILAAFTIGTVITLYKICDMMKVKKERIWRYLLITPSFLMFILFNWDMIAIFFSILSIYLYLRKENTKSAISLGLGISAKIYPAVLLPVLLLEEKTWRRRISFLIYSLGTFLLLNLPFMISSYETWFGTWAHHMAWGIENSWLIYIFNQMDLKAHYVGFAVLIYLVYKGLVETSKKEYRTTAERIVERSWLMSIAWLFGSYVVTPQMALMILPFFVLIPLIPLPLVYLADTLNALIIVFWFSEMDAGRNPIASDNPIQLFAAARQLLWLSFFIYCLYPKKILKLLKTLLKRVEK